MVQKKYQLILILLLLMLVFVVGCKDKEKADPPPTPEKGKDKVYQMATEFDSKRVDIIVDFEGGCTTDNQTYKGIMQEPNWNDYLAKTKDTTEGSLPQKVCTDGDGKLSDALVQDYYEFYWRGDNLDNSPNHHKTMYPNMIEPLAFVIFDSRVNMGDGFTDVPGPNGAIELLQEVLNKNEKKLDLSIGDEKRCEKTGEFLCVDGGWGPATKNALISAGVENQMEIAEQVLSEREFYYCNTKKSDLPGWLNRVESIKNWLEDYDKKGELLFLEKSDKFKNVEQATEHCETNFL